LVPIGLINGRYEIPCSFAKRVELRDGVGVAAGKVALSYEYGDAVQGLDDISSVNVKEFFGSENRDSLEGAIP